MNTIIKISVENTTTRIDMKNYDGEFVSPNLIIVYSAFISTLPSSWLAGTTVKYF